MVPFTRFIKHKCVTEPQGTGVFGTEAPPVGIEPTTHCLEGNAW
jgi:hypothetical protein